MSVYVLDLKGRPLMPCTEKRARLLLERSRAVVKNIVPFAIQLKDRLLETCKMQDVELKIDPGSKFTGICLSRTDNGVVNVLNLYELEHRGSFISMKLKARAMYRRARRGRNTRYRQPRFLNRVRGKKVGWLPPSLLHRIDAVMSWVRKLQRWSPVVMLAVERVKFDMQKMRDKSISGVEYQRGTLFEKEVMEYLLEKWNRKCAYCGDKGSVFEKEHVVPRCKGGTNTISNLVLSCTHCNQAKGNLDIQEFLKNKPEILTRVLSQLKKPLRDAAAVNTTRNRLFTELLKTGLPVATGSGAETKWNRSKFNIPKTHALDAACVGEIHGVKLKNTYHLNIKCQGRGRYCRTLTDKYGFFRARLPRTKEVRGFQTGDTVRATSIKYQSTTTARITVRTTGSFYFIKDGKTHNVNWRNCKLIQKNNGYGYSPKKYHFTTDANGRTTTL